MNSALIQSRLASGQPIEEEVISGVPQCSIETSELRDAIIEFCRGRDTESSFRLRISGYEIQGDLDLSHLNLPIHFAFCRCRFRGHISFVRSKLRSLTLDGSNIQSFDGFGMHIDGNLYMGKGFVSSGSIRLINARIGTRLSFRGGKFLEGNIAAFKPDHDHLPPIGAIDACNLTVGGSFYMDDDPAEDSKEIYCDENKFPSPPEEVRSQGFHAKAGREFECRGLITLRGARIGGRWYVGGKVYAGSVYRRAEGESGERKMSDQWRQSYEDETQNTIDTSSPARYIQTCSSIEAYCIEVSGSVHFSETFESKGMVRLSGAKVGGKVSFKGCKLYEVAPTEKIRSAIVVLGRGHSLPHGALDAFGACIGGSLYFDSGSDENQIFESRGLVGLKNIEVGGRVIIRKANFRGYDKKKPKWEPGLIPLIFEDFSLDLAGASIRANLLFRENTEFEGTVRLQGATIGGRLRIKGAEFRVYGVSADESETRAFERKNLFRDPPGKDKGVPGEHKDKEDVQHVALNASSLVVAEDFTVRGKETLFYGMVNINFSRIGTEICLTEATFLCPARYAWEDFQAGSLKTLSGLFRSHYCRAISAENVSCSRFTFARSTSAFPSSNGEPYTPVSACKRIVGKVLLHHARVSGLLDIRGVEDPNGGTNTWGQAELHLEESSCGTLSDNRESPTLFRCNGFVYSSIDRHSLLNVNTNERLDRMANRYGKQANGPYRSQPYEQLAFTLYKSGLRKQSNEVLERSAMASFKSQPQRPWVICKRAFIAIFGFGDRMMKRALFGLALVFVILFWGNAFGASDWLELESEDLEIAFAKTVEEMRPPGFNSVLFSGDSNDTDIPRNAEQAAFRLLSQFLWIIAGWGLVANYSSRKPSV